MEALIVGHGPSLLDAGHGDRIDSFETVIRLKGCDKLLKRPQDFGTRTEYACASTEACHPLLSLFPHAQEYWLYPKKGQWHPSVEELYKGKPHHIALAETAPWNAYFRNAAGWEGGVKHRNVSTGMAAILIAAQRLKPDTIWLAGFDSTLDPFVEYESTFNPGTSHKDMHDWFIEHNMIPLIENRYATKVRNFLER